MKREAALPYMTLNKTTRLSSLPWKMVIIPFLEAETWTKQSFREEFIKGFPANQKKKKTIFSKTFALSLYAKAEVLVMLIPVSSVVLVITDESPEECLRYSDNEGP